MKKLFLVALSIGWGLTMHVSAETLASYLFADKPTAGKANIKSGSIREEFGIGRGVKSGVLSVSALAVTKPASLFLQDRSFDAANEAGAKAENDYIYCTITPKEGKTVSLSNLTFYTLRRDLNNEGAGAPDHFAVYTSADDYTALVGSGTIDLKSGDARDFSKHSIDLSSVKALQSINKDVQIRIYFWASQGTGSGREQRTFRLDDLSVSGTVE